MMPELHVLFGAGQVGYPLAQQLLSAGKRVRIVKRSSGHVPAGSETVLGDASDPALCANAARGATTIYHCMNPAYNARIWAELIPRYMDNLIAAAAGTSARLAAARRKTRAAANNGIQRERRERCLGKRTPTRMPTARTLGSAALVVFIGRSVARR
jgi:nucleoside-diphosphate-sugar epimerase